MNKKIIYIILFFILTSSLFILMPFYRSNMDIEKRDAAVFPSLTLEDGSFNREFFDQLTDYFNDSFAFRQELATCDAAYKAAVFRTSNTEKAILGRDGWLFFGGTLNDYTGRELLNEREINGAARNLTLIDEYVTVNGGHFVFTIVPNKSSLYPQYMPSRYLSAEGDTNYENLIANIDGIDFLDLYAVLSSQDDVLYHMWDSHWNNRGAALAYEALMQHTGLPYIDYSAEPYEVTRSHRGDIFNLIFPSLPQLDENVEYSRGHVFEYRNPVESTEDLLIMSTSSSGQSSLVMFRDSFGNAWIPFIADSFANATFSKGTPYNLDFIRSMPHEYVVIEMVERNIPNLIEFIPTMDAPERPLDTVSSAVAAVSDEVTLELTDKDTRYFVTGTVDPALTADDSPVYIRVTSPEGTFVYEAFQQYEYSFGLYIPKIQINTIEVITSCGDILYTVSKDI